MRTLETTGALNEIVGRMERLEPTSPRLWGSMQHCQMLRHLTSAMQAVLTLDMPHGSWTPLRNRVGRWFVLGTDIRWPRNVPTVPELKRLHEQPVDPALFHQDRAALIDLTRRFPLATALPPAHPFFGPLTRAEWMRWAYLHADHHLRQFSC